MNTFIKSILLSVLVTVLVLLPTLTSCASFGSHGPGIVVYVSADGTVEARSDGNTLVAWGEGAGQIGAFGKVSGIDIPLQYDVQKGFVYVKSKSNDFSGQIPIGSPLPSYCAALFQEGEAADLGFTFLPEGFEYPSEPTPAPAPAGTPVSMADLPHDPGHRLQSS